MKSENLLLVLAVLALCFAIFFGKFNKRKSVVTERSFTNASAITKKKLPSLSEDFVLGSVTAVSNAVLANAPAPGWSIACAPDGSYAAMSPNGSIMDITDYTVSTNRFRAVVATWRYKEIWDSVEKEVYKPIQFGKSKNWQPCDN